jgi:hypothetical protein
MLLCTRLSRSINGGDICEDLTSNQILEKPLLHGESSDQSYIQQTAQLGTSPDVLQHTDTMSTSSMAMSGVMT